VINVILEFKIGYEYSCRICITHSHKNSKYTTMPLSEKQQHWHHNITIFYITSISYIIIVHNLRIKTRRPLGAIVLPLEGHYATAKAG
jgi:hypothetical protein